MGRRQKDYNPLTDENIVSESLDECVKFNRQVIDLLRKLLNMATEESEELSPADKENFETLLRFGSFAEAAKKTHNSDYAIRESAAKALNLLLSQARIWQSPHAKLVELQQQIAELKKIHGGKFAVEQHQLEAMRLLRKENERLKKIVETYEPAPLPKAGLWVQAGDTMRLKLSRKLAQAGLPSLTVTRLESHGIITICDAVRYTESQISKLPGVSLSDVEKVVSRIRYMGLHMGMVVKWDPTIGNYMIQT